MNGVPSEPSQMTDEPWEPKASERPTPGDVADEHLARVLRHRLKAIEKAAHERELLTNELEKIEAEIEADDREVRALRTVLSASDYDELGQPKPDTYAYAVLEAEAKRQSRTTAR